MKQEYLFTGNENRKEISEYSHKSVKKQIQEIDNSNCWIARFSIDSESESSAKTLSDVHVHIKKYAPYVLSNESSAYFNKALFPHFNEFERNLRKFLYLKSALSTDKIDSEVINNLESKDFGEIFTALFSDSVFVQNVKKAVNDKTWQFSKNEIISTIQKTNENTRWDTAIGENVVPTLRLKFPKVKEYRNDVMHAHNIDYDDYSKALKMIQKINGELTFAISMLVDDKGSDSDNKFVFNEIIKNAIKELDEAEQKTRTQEKLAAIRGSFLFNQDDSFTRINDLRKQFFSSDADSFSTQPELSVPTLTQQMKEDVLGNIQPSIEEIKKNLGMLSQSQNSINLHIKDLLKYVQSSNTDINPEGLEK